MKFICSICGEELKFVGTFFNHLNNMHNKNYTKEQFYDLYLRKNPEEGTCLKCGKPTQFSAKNRSTFYI